MSELPTDDPTARQWGSMSQDEQIRYAAGYLIYALDRWHNPPSFSLRVNNAMGLVRGALGIGDNDE